MSERTLNNDAAHDMAPGWFKLDNAARIYPAIKKRNWASIFRLSVTLKEPVKPELLQLALDKTLKRMPSFSVRMKAGLFWYYFEHRRERLDIRRDSPEFTDCVPGGIARDSLFCVQYLGRTVSIDAFHSVTDGYGGLVFLKTMVVEYLNLCGCRIIPTHGVLDCSEPSRPEETEDDFAKFANLGVVAGRRESRAFQIRGTVFVPREAMVTTGVVSLERMLAEARTHNATITEYMTAAYLFTLYNVQESMGEGRRLPVKVSVPVNLRKFYDSKTLRNFSTYINPGIEPRNAEYTFDEILLLVRRYMREEITEKRLNARIASNVRSERNLAVRLTPLFAKNWLLLGAFRLWGESRFSSTLTNVGAIDVPEGMKPHIESFDAILGPPRSNKVCCTVTSYGDSLRINFTRTIVEEKVEKEFFSFLERSGIPVETSAYHWYAMSDRKVRGETPEDPCEKESICGAGAGSRVYALPFSAIAGRLGSLWAVSRAFAMVGPSVVTEAVAIVKWSLNMKEVGRRKLHF